MPILMHMNEACEGPAEEQEYSGCCTVGGDEEGRSGRDHNESAEQAVREIVKRFGRSVETLAD
jgi:hypothetical protein